MDKGNDYTILPIVDEDAMRQPYIELMETGFNGSTPMTGYSDNVVGNLYKQFNTLQFHYNPIDSTFFEPLNPKKKGLAPWLIEVIDAADNVDRLPSSYYALKFPCMPFKQPDGVHNLTIRIPIRIPESSQIKLKDILDEVERITPEFNNELEGIGILNEQPYIVKDGVYVGYNKIEAHEIVEINAYGGFNEQIDLIDKIPQLSFVANRVGRVLKDMGYLRYADAESYVRNC